MHLQKVIDTALPQKENLALISLQVTLLFSCISFYLGIHNSSVDVINSLQAGIFCSTANHNTTNSVSVLATAICVLTSFGNGTFALRPFLLIKSDVS